MADKSPKFIDIKSADKATPSSTSRPILVTNRSVLGNDPMVNPADDASDAKPAGPVTHAEKVIKPVSADLVAPEAEDATAPLVGTEPEVPETPELSKPATEAEVPKSEAAVEAAPEPTIEEDTTDAPAIPTSRDAAAESQADEAKATAEAEAAVVRESELEGLINSGKYNAPINTAHRKRSRAIAVVLCILALLLAVAVADAAVDAGMVQVDGVPHTDILKDK
jgi:hypothetical protein